MPVFRRLLQALFLVCVLLLLAACDTKELIQKFVPPDDDAFARRFIDALRAEDYALTDQLLAPSLRDEKTQAGLREIGRVLGRGELLSTEVTGCVVSVNGAGQTTNLSYQLHLSEGWVAGNVVLAREQGSAAAIVGGTFQSIPNSLEVINRFSFAGRPLRHSLVFMIWVAIPLVILTALVHCIRSRIQRKWLWVLFIVLGFVQFRFHWTSGQFEIQPLAALLFGASVFRPGLYGPWIFSFALPVGAVAFLIRRRKLMLKDAAQAAQQALEPAARDQGQERDVQGI